VIHKGSFKVETVNELAVGKARWLIHGMWFWGSGSAFVQIRLCIGSSFKWITLVDLYFMMKVIELTVTGISYGFILLKLDWWADICTPKPRDTHVSFCHINWFTIMFCLIDLLTC
jgi:hypothetical protein